MTNNTAMARYPTTGPQVALKFRYMGWTEVADLIVKGMEDAIAAKTVTYDFARLMPDAKEVKCSEFGDAIIEHMHKG